MDIPSGYKKCECGPECLKVFKINHAKPNTRFYHGHAPKAQLISCGDGCGILIKSIDKYGRPRKYVDHHSNNNSLEAKKKMSISSITYWNQHQKERLKNLELARAVKKGIVTKPVRTKKVTVFPFIANKLRMLFRKEDEVVLCGCNCGTKIINQDIYMMRNRKYILGHNAYNRDATFYSNLAKSYRRYASRPEQVLCKIISDNHLPLKFTGLGRRKEYWFGGVGRYSKAANPDFVGIGVPLVIEEQGIYFHNREETKKKDVRKKDVLEQNGFCVRYIWENELVKCQGMLPLSEDKVVSRIKMWIDIASNFSTQMNFVFET